MKYTTQHIQALFNVSHQTVKNWVAEFATYLSPSATPESGRARQFTEEDLRVLALVSEMKTRSATYEDIHAALQTGQRGTLPDSFTTALAPTPSIVSALADMREQMTLLNETIQNLQLSISRKDGQIDLLKEQLKEAQTEVSRLQRENARLTHDD